MTPKSPVVDETFRSAVIAMRTVSVALQQIHPQGEVDGVHGKVFEARALFIEAWKLYGS